MSATVAIVCIYFLYICYNYTKNVAIVLFVINGNTDFDCLITKTK